MAALLVLLHLGGAVALLLWATRMVRTGVERAYGHILKKRLRYALGNPFYAVGFGGLLAVVLQSSTAVVLLVSSFVGSGFVSAAAGLMAVRGGELGSALLVKVLVLDLDIVVSALLIGGTFVFLTTERREWRQCGRISIGVALLLLSLEMTRNATAPLRDSAALPTLIAYLSEDLVSSFLLAALITYLFHSSIASIILVASFAHHGLIDHHLALVMVLGVNFGSSLIAPILTRRAPPSQRIVPLGNLLMRGAGSLIMLAVMSMFALPLDFLGASGSDLVVNGHIMFNIMVMVLGIIFARFALKITQKLVILTSKNSKSTPIEAPSSQPFLPSALNFNALDNPNLAITSARREIIRIADIVDMMLEKIVESYETPSKEAIVKISAIAKILNKRQGEFAHYLATLGGSTLDKQTLAQIKNLLDDGTKLQQTGHIISHSMLESVKEMANGKITFPKEEREEFLGLCGRIIGNARLAFYLLVANDVATAKQLVREKDDLRLNEQRLRHHHFERIQNHPTSDMRASMTYLDLLNDLKQINALLTSMAYPILEGQGLLKETRLEQIEGVYP